MKKILLLAVAILGLSASAQEKKADKGLQGTFWVAGQVSFNTSKTGDIKTTSNTILPIVGYFVSPSVTVGLGVGNINTTLTNVRIGNSTITGRINTFVVEPLVRKYWNIKGNLFFFGQAAVPIMLGTDRINDQKSTSAALAIDPGFDYIINKWLTVETSFTVLSAGVATVTPAEGPKTSSWGISANPFDMTGGRSIGGLRVGVKILF